MRILISNSDSIGDFVLREPLFTALTQAGHELALVVRSFVAPLARWVAPQAHVIHLGDDPYSPDFDANAASVQGVIDSARTFAPEIYGIIQYQRTVFEEILAESLSGARVFGLDGYLYRGSIDDGLDLRSRMRFDEPVNVSIDSPDLRKNELFCSALLQKKVTLPRPAFPPDAGDSESARARLEQLGLSRGTYWVACVGDGSYRRVRNWNLDGWGAVLSHCVREHGWRLLLVGTPDESQSTEDVRDRMGEARAAAFNVCDSGDGLNTLLSLVGMSAGYIGRDTGPMHIAAAFGKPVLAIFGGGNWPRFTPAAQTGLVFTVPLACAGCNWLCPLPDSYCIKRVPVPDVIAGIDELAGGGVSNLQIRALDPDSILTAQIIRESCATAAEERRKHNAARLQRTGLSEELVKVTAERDRLRPEVEALRQDAATQKLDLEHAAAARAEAEQESNSLAEELANVVAERDSLKTRLDLAWNQQRIQGIDAKRLLAGKDGEKQELVNLVFELKHELEIIENTSLGPAAEASAAVNPDEAGEAAVAAEISICAAFPIAVHRIFAARGHRIREFISMASAAFAMISRRLGSVAIERNRIERNRD